MHITAIAIRFFRDVAYGSLAASPVKFNGPPYQPGCYGDIAAKLADCLAADRFAAFLQEIEPLTPEYAAVKNKIALFYKTVTDSAYKDVPVITCKVDTTNTPLLARLNQLGILDSKGSVVDPARINWRSLNTQNFPYTLRQGTGCLLHDTATR